jgi:hypothetical protein
MRIRAQTPSLAALLTAITAALASVGEATAFAIRGPEDVREHLIQWRGADAFLVIDGREWELVTDPASPLVSSLGDGSFHPMDEVEVAAALRATAASRHFSCRIMILPFPRQTPMRSSFENGVIVLSPGVRPVSAEHVHATVTHELGHLVQRELASEGSPSWERYLDLRGLRGSEYRRDAAHRNRPREIFAEDFRFLMGGALATSSGTIENPDLPLPDQVRGLPQWFESLLEDGGTRERERLPAPRSFPNPFRGSSESLHVQFSVDAASTGALTGTVYNAIGRRVRSLAGQRINSFTVEFRWNGRDEAGTRVSSGIYLVRWRENPTAGVARVHVLR